MDRRWRERRDTFGEVAQRYDERRPGYPDAAFDDLLRLADLDPRSRVLEVGAGTGKATVALAARDLAVTALEPNRRMAEVLERNTGGWGAVRVEIGTFEAHTAESGAYDLVVAAQSWHWIEGAVGLRRAAELLGAAGWIALLWNTPVDRGGDVALELDAVYERLAPGMVTQWAGSEGSLTPARWGRELEGSPHFGEVEAVSYPWTAAYTSDEYVGLLSTHSTHRLLEEGHRRRLLAAVADVVDRNGGEIAIRYRCQLYAAPVVQDRRPDRRP